MQMGRPALAYISILLFLVALSLGVTFYRYMVLQDFAYFQTEDEIADQFDVSSYSEL